MKYLLNFNAHIDTFALYIFNKHKMYVVLSAFSSYKQKVNLLYLTAFVLDYQAFGLLAVLVASYLAFVVEDNQGIFVDLSIEHIVVVDDNLLNTLFDYMNYLKN